MHVHRNWWIPEVWSGVVGLLAAMVAVVIASWVAVRHVGDGPSGELP